MRSLAPTQRNRLPVQSLQRRLQSTALLAVLAGYGLLLSANYGLSTLQRRKSHQQLVQQIVVQRDWRAQGLHHRLSLYPGVSNHAPRLESSRAGTWLVSITPLPPQATGGRVLSLVLRQDISAQVERERLTQLLLLVAAGVSSLFTSALLRPVLRKGLVEPLQQLEHELGSTPMPPQSGEPLAVERQPLELRPIAAAFNDLQQRMVTSWERERLFVDGVAHELRTPITLMSGLVQSLMRLPAQDRAQVQEGLGRIEAESQRMTTLVSDLLDLARLDAGRLSLLPKPVDPEAALLEAHERLTPVAAGRLRLQLEEPLPLAAADPDRLQQCLTALIDNALRYSPSPRPVQLSAEATAQELVFHVRDQGPGVSVADRERIFERFVRGAAAEDTRGSGIGLSIVRLLMDAMGGSVAVSAAPGGGADFELRLPRA